MSGRLETHEDDKATGERWLGDVPRHWNGFKRKRLIADVDSGASVNASDEPANDDELGVLKTSSVDTGDYRPCENKSVLGEEYGRVSCQLKVNTLIVIRMNTPDLGRLMGAASLGKPNPTCDRL